MSSKLGLQIMMAIIGTVSVVTALPAVLRGLPEESLGKVPQYDNEYRYFAAIWVGLGVAFFLMIPRVATETFMFRVLSGMIIWGGCARMWGVWRARYSLPTNLKIASVIELIVLPLLVVWQGSIQGQ